MAFDSSRLFKDGCEHTVVGSSAQHSPEVPAAIVTSVGWPSSLLTLPPGLLLFPQLPSMKDNYLFLKEVKNLVEKTNCELKVCFQYINRGDRWIQVRNPKLGRTWPEESLKVHTLAPSSSLCGNSAVGSCVHMGTETSVCKAVPSSVASFGSKRL